MSATGRGAERAPSDLYETAPWIVHRLLEAVKLPGGHWVEPCAGRGRIITAARQLRPDVQWTACEILEDLIPTLSAVDPTMPVICGNFLTSELVAGPCERATVVLTNPPYSLAEEFLARCRMVAPNAWVVFLLRINFLASEERAPLMRTCAPDMYVLPNRPSFEAEGRTDSTEYAWFLWQPESMRQIYGPRRSGRHQVLASTPLAVRKAQRIAPPAPAPGP